MTLQYTVKIVKVRDLVFHTECFGIPQNPTCLLIAGAMASVHFWTDEFCNQLASEGFFVIRYDHRDIGESSTIDWSKNPYTLADLASDAISILDAYGVHQAHFVGHSMGGYLCQKIALEFPERTLSITTISAGPLELTPAAKTPLTKEEQAIQEKTWKVFLSRKDGPSKETKIQSFLPVWGYLNGHFVLDEDMAISYTRDLVMRSKTVKAGNHHELVMQNLEREQKDNFLHQIDLPTLVIHGDLDPLVLPRYGRAVAHAIPNSHFVMIPGMGHLLFNRELESQIAKLILDHIKSTTRKT